MVNLNKTGQRGKSKKYFANSNFFKNSENWKEKEVYFLGWLLSDGHHNIKRGQIQIRLQEKDKQILEKLKNIIEYTGPLHYMKRGKINNLIKKCTKTYQNRWCLDIRDWEISNDLINLGINNNKTNNLTFPKCIKTELIPHFIRAFYDGDGTVSYSYVNNRLSFSLNLISTPKFCNEIIEILSNKLKINFNIHRHKSYGNGNIVIRLNGYLSALKFFNYIYKDANFILKRKFRKFLRLINYCKRKKWIRHEKIYKEEINKSIEIAKQIINKNLIKV